MVDLVYYLRSLLFFDIPKLYYYINVRSSTIFSLFFGDVYLSLGISLSSPIFSASFIIVPELFSGDVRKTFVILSATLLPIKSAVAPGVF